MRTPQWSNDRLPSGAIASPTCLLCSSLLVRPLRHLNSGTQYLEPLTKWGPRAVCLPVHWRTSRQCHPATIILFGALSISCGRRGFQPVPPQTCWRQEGAWRLPADPPKGERPASGAAKRDDAGAAQRILPPLPHGFPHFRVRLSIGGLGWAAAGNLPAPVAYSV